MNSVNYPMKEVKYMDKVLLKDDYYSINQYCIEKNYLLDSYESGFYVNTSENIAPLQSNGSIAYAYYNGNEWVMEYSRSKVVKTINYLPIYTVEVGQTITVNDSDTNVNFKYTGDVGTTATIILSGFTFVISNSGGNFIWDLGGENYNFGTGSTGTHQITVSGTLFTINFTRGSLYFGIRNDGPEPITTVFISANQNNSLSLNNLGQAWSWGRNSSGQLGDNSIVNKSTPVAVCGGHTFTTISEGVVTSLALDNLGQAWSWGSFNYGKLGNNNDSINQSTPVAVCGNHTFTTISAGYTNHSLAIDNLGQAWSWGRNNKGQIGDNTVLDKSTPVAVCGGHTFTSISAGGRNSLAIDNLGQAWGWGYNTYGQVGDNTIVDVYIPVAVCGNHTFTTISAGYGHSLAIDNLGQAWGWGDNTYGQVGTMVNKSTPVAVCGNHTFIKIYGGFTHSLAIDNLGQAWSWGANTFGQLGDNSIIQKNTPMAVCGGHTFTAISVGSNHSLGVDNLGRVWSWGQNNYGQLGSDILISTLTPVRVCNL